MNIDERKFYVIPLRGVTIFPKMMLVIDVDNGALLHALDKIIQTEDKLCILTAQEAKDETGSLTENLADVGVLARVDKLVRRSGESVHVVFEGKARVQLLGTENPGDGVAQTKVEVLHDKNVPEELLAEAWSREILDQVELIGRVSEQGLGGQIANALLQEDDTSLSELCDRVTAQRVPDWKDRQNVLETLDVQIRARLVRQLLEKETTIARLENSIRQQVRQSIDKGQKEYYLREQMRVIRDELGEGDSPEAESEELREKLASLQMPEECREKVEKEIKRYGGMSPASHEAPMLRSWLDWVLELPWGIDTVDNFNLAHVRKVLDADHYGLDEVKDRVIEQLAVCQLRQSVQGNILCLLGPPGVGKTSIASSIARATGREFVRMSLGGIHDESEIRGHRRTYIGAMPGRIIAALKQAGSMNPVLLLDEVDKVGTDFRGDPTAALLEVLDSAQNSTFRDNYIEMPFDLSRVFFICTANSLAGIPAPLRDRMEIVELSSYTEDEKCQIGKRHLLPKQIKEHGLPDGSLKMGEPSIRDIVRGYTREAGVRSLERQIAKVCRKVAAQIVSNDAERVTVTAKKLQEYLGPPRFRRKKEAKEAETGVVTGLAWTSVGGETLQIEVTPLVGTGKLVLTGQLGEVMRESAQAAYTYARYNAARFGIDPLFYTKTDLHIHIPEGAVPKDGPSAGVSLATAMISALSGIAVRKEVAMTGEITLHGKVLNIGGLKEKSIAAAREGITEIIVPEGNKADVQNEVPESVREACHFYYAKTIDDVLRQALVQRPQAYVSPEKADEETLEFSQVLVREEPKLRPGV